MAGIGDLTEWLQHHQHWVAITVFLIAFIESLAIAGIIVPGVALLFAVATIAGSGALSLFATLAAAFFGAVAGDGLSFLIGRHFKERIYQVWPISRYPKLVTSGESFFDRHGGKSILIGRFIGPIRPVLPLVAGALSMPSRRFLAFNLISAIGWAPLYVLPGFLVGASMQMDITLPSHFYPILIGSLILLTLLGFLFSRLNWSLGTGGAIYQSIQRKVTLYNSGHEFWRGLASRRPTGGEFPLASLTIAGGAGALFAILSLMVLYTPWLQTIDQFTQAFFAALRTPLLDPVFITLTLMGDEAHSYLVFSILVITFVSIRQWAAAVTIATAGIATAIATHGIKYAYSLPRPDTLLVPLSSNGFPSGHSSASTVFWFLIASFIAQEMHQGHRWKAYIACSVPVACIILSRLYLGVHWLSDVMGGLLLGLAIVGVARVCFSPFDRTPLTPGPRIWMGTTLLIVASTCYVILRFSDAILKYLPA